MILAKLDEAQNPTYNQEGFLDRNGLTEAVITVLNVMTTSVFNDFEWCPLMQSISDNTDRYFDATINPNPARDAFSRDWGRAMLLAGCR